MEDNFWQCLQTLADSHKKVIERPKNSAHPKYPDYIYPLDYGYLENTSSSDGDDIDIWIGSEDTSKVTGIVSTCDPVKADVETKILIGCSKKDFQKILKAHNRGNMTAKVIPRY